jgi:hypothetical protein
VLTSASFLSVKLNVSGVVSGGGATVETLYVVSTHPILKVVLVVDEFQDGAIKRTLTVSPLSIFPELEVNHHPFMLYNPDHHTTLIGEGEFIPVIVTELEVCVEERATSVSSINEKLSGIVSGARVVTIKSELSVPIVRLAVFAIPAFTDDIVLTITISPFSITHDDEVNIQIPPSSISSNSVILTQLLF